MLALLLSAFSAVNPEKNATVTMGIQVRVLEEKQIMKAAV
jgi:hypothetical protein